MPAPRRPRSLGVLFTLLPLAGAFAAGAIWREPVMGLVAGLALAALLTTLFWLLDRQT